MSVRRLVPLLALLVPLSGNGAAGHLLIGAAHAGLLKKTEHFVCETNTVPAGPNVEVGFSPGAGASNVIMRAINSARRELRMAAYSLTHKPIAEALLEAARRGVDVKILADRSQRTEPYSVVTFLANQRIPVRIDATHDKLHSKFIVVDGQHVQTGSANYSASATSRNEENAIVLWNQVPLARSYLAQWDAHWAHAEPLKPRY